MTGVELKRRGRSALRATAVAALASLLAACASAPRQEAQLDPRNGDGRERGGKLTLDTLDIQHAVTGPITSIDQASQTLVVLGQKIRLNLAGDKPAVDAFKTLQAGDVVSVSGLRLADGTVVATRVD